MIFKLSNKGFFKIILIIFFNLNSDMLTIKIIVSKTQVFRNPSFTYKFVIIIIVVAVIARRLHVIFFSQIIYYVCLYLNEKKTHTHLWGQLKLT